MKKEVLLKIYVKQGEDITIVRNFEINETPSDKYLGFPEIYELKLAIENNIEKVVDFMGLSVVASNVAYFEYEEIK